MKRMLVISSKFTPSNNVGSRRIIRICKYLDKLKWKIIVVTLKKKYYAETNDDECCRLTELPKSIKIFRTEKLDPVFHWRYAGVRGKNNKGRGDRKRDFNRRHVGCDGRENEGRKSFCYHLHSGFSRIFQILLDLMKFPDSEITWLPVAVFCGLRIIRKEKVDVIFSSGPKHSNHLVAVLLKVLSGRGLVLDFRDPWARSPWRESKRSSTLWERYKHKLIILLERFVVHKADGLVFITEELKNDFQRHYPHLAANKFRVFYNGFDPELIEMKLICDDVKVKKTIPPSRFVHAGALYKLRDPLPILEAVRNLVQKKLVDSNKLYFQFIGRVSQDLFHAIDFVKKHDLGGIVQFLPAVSYKESLELMNAADVLVLLQPFTKVQVPGKFYDYICFNNPLLAVGEKNSELEKLVRGRFGLFTDYHQISEIEEGILYFLEHPEAYREKVKIYKEDFDISKSVTVFESILSSTLT